MAGDIILKVNGESIEGLRLPDVIKKIAGPAGHRSPPDGEACHRRRGRAEDDARRDRRADRQRLFAQADNTWDYYCCDDPKIAYIRITQFTPRYVRRSQAAIMEKLLADGMKGLILDLRFNPGGRLDQAIELSICSSIMA